MGNILKHINIVSPLELKHIIRQNFSNNEKKVDWVEEMKFLKKMLPVNIFPEAKKKKIVYFSW